MPSLALAGGHSGLGGNGTGVVVAIKTMEGKSGVLVHQTTSDVWIYDNPPEGFPKATSATCSNLLLLRWDRSNLLEALLLAKSWT